MSVLEPLNLCIKIVSLSDLERAYKYYQQFILYLLCYAYFTILYGKKGSFRCVCSNMQYHFLPNYQIMIIKKIILNPEMLTMKSVLLFCL